MVIEPSAGCVATSWKVDGEEVLALPSPREDFLRSVRTGGIPLLYPYANRLRSDQFEVARKPVDLRVDENLKRDPSGFPIHGLLLRWGEWELSRQSESRLEASIKWSAHPRLMAPYPFPHTLKLTWELGVEECEAGREATLKVTTTIDANEGSSVPIAFGWHPYLAVGDIASARIELPARKSIALGSNGLPSLNPLQAPWIPASSEPVGGNQDALFELSSDVAQRVITVVDGSRRTILSFDAGYMCLQLYSPEGKSFACLEPMSAPTSALTDGAIVLPAGSRSQAVFQIRRRLSLA